MTKREAERERQRILGRGRESQRERRGGDAESHTVGRETDSDKQRAREQDGEMREKDR